jgi:GNAT superfamily N-acetyltransferase
MSRGIVPLPSRHGSWRDPGRGGAGRRSGPRRVRSESNDSAFVLPDNAVGGRIGPGERSRTSAWGFEMDRTTVGSLLRSTQAYCSELCEKETLDYGIAYYNARFAALPEANQFREVLIQDRSRIPEAFEQAEAWFQQRGLFCHRWAPAAGQATTALTNFLTQRAFTVRRSTAMALARWVVQGSPEQVRILPARAMREAYRGTFIDADAAGWPATRELLAEASLERLDDPQLDMVVALWGKQPVGRCGLYQVGDFARVMSVSVIPAFAGRGVEQALLAHVLALAKRLTMRTILVQVDETDAPTRILLEEAGFVADGEIVEFERHPPGSRGVGS